VARLRKRFDHQRTLNGVQVDSASGQGRVRRAVGGRSGFPRRTDRQVLAADIAAIGEDHGPLDRVAQFAHVAGPRIRQEMAFRIALDARRRPPDSLADLAQEHVRKLQHIVHALAQGWRDSNTPNR
jgi:hypothetical protein